MAEELVVHQVQTQAEMVPNMQAHDRTTEAFQKGGVSMEDNEISSKKGPQERPIKKRMETPEGVPVHQAIDETYEIVKAELMAEKERPIVERCPHCQGKGKYPNKDNEWALTYYECETCDGTGKVIRCPGPGCDFVHPSNSNFNFCHNCGSINVR